MVSFCMHIWMSFRARRRNWKQQKDTGEWHKIQNEKKKHFGWLISIEIFIDSCWFVMQVPNWMNDGVDVCIPCTSVCVAVERYDQSIDISWRVFCFVLSFCLHSHLRFVVLSSLYTYPYLASQFAISRIE